MDDKNRITVVLSSEEFHRFTAYCTEKGHKKSTLIKRLIREYLDREAYQTPPSQGNDSPAPARPASTRRAERPRG